MIEVYTQSLEGTWFATAINKQQIITTSFGDSQQTTINTILSNLPFNVPFQVFHEPSASAKNMLAILKSIYDGKDTNANPNLATARIPPYTLKVLKATSAIPLGYVTTYGAIAKAVGGGPRAVGNVMASNPFAPIVPCHRVVKSDLGLGGYGAGGLRVKLEFLRREKRGFSEPKEIDVGNGCLAVFPVEFVLKKYS